MKYKHARTLLKENEYFSHGEGLRGDHVDCVVTVDFEGYVLNRRDATEDEIVDNCLV